MAGLSVVVAALVLIVVVIGCTESESSAPSTSRSVEITFGTGRSVTTTSRATTTTKASNGCADAENRFLLSVEAVEQGFRAVATVGASADLDDYEAAVSALAGMSSAMRSLSDSLDVLIKRNNDLQAQCSHNTDLVEAADLIVSFALAEWLDLAEICEDNLAMYGVNCWS